MSNFNYKGIASKMDNLVTTEIVLQGDEFRGAKVKVRNLIGMNDVSAVVEGIASSVVNMNEATYQPELYDFIFRMVIMDVYAGIAMPEKDQDKAYRVLMHSDVFEQVCKHINDDQLLLIDDMTHEKIDYYRSLLVSTAGAKTMELLGKIADVTNSIGNLSTEISATNFKGAIDNLTVMLNQNVQQDNAVDNNVVQLTKG